MKWFAFVRALMVLSAVAGLVANARGVTIAWSPVGNPGNAPDTTVMQVDGTSGYGSVPYSYNIGTYDVTNSQYVEFLNTKDPNGANVLNLYNTVMTTSSFGGINFNAGNAPGARYTVIAGDGNHPVNYVNWYSALRFANWMNNGQGSADTETGAYTLGVLGAGAIPTSPNTITRNAGATIFLPSENEWYKAAYYSPATHSYFAYPTSSNTPPAMTVPTSAPNSANLGNVVGNLTNVGAYSGTTSPYGAFDMGGNVQQWNEALISGHFRGYRGGALNSTPDALLSSARVYGIPGVDTTIGFRLASIASVPEPGTAVLGLIAAGVLLLCRRARNAR